MAGGSGRREGKGSQTTAGRARTALLDGDFAQARALAQQVLEDASAQDAEKQEAREVLDATRVDRGPIVAGLIILTILVVLFAWVLTQRHGG